MWSISSEDLDFLDPDLSGYNPRVLGKRESVIQEVLYALLSLNPDILHQHVFCHLNLLLRFENQALEEFFMIRRKDIDKIQYLY